MSPTAAEYRHDPGGAAATAFWKLAACPLPRGVTVRHARDDAGPGGERYFKLVHDLVRVDDPTLPPGCALLEIADDAWTDPIVATINRSYADLRVTPDDVRAWRERPVHEPDLWLGVSAEGRLVASCVADLDPVVRELSLDWVQVLPGWRGRGLGRALVLAALRRGRARADFATVAGEMANPTSPDALYRACGFTGDDVWVVRRTPVGGAR